MIKADGLPKPHNHDLFFFHKKADLIRLLSGLHSRLHTIVCRRQACPPVAGSSTVAD
jgi:hypothetical protein